MSSFLTWPAARDLALAGTPVRRDTWVTPGDPVWLERRPGLWMLTDENHAPVRVVDADFFESSEFFGTDWTDDPPGTTRDVCLIDPPRPIFRPPGIGLTGVVTSSTAITLHADIGSSSPAGTYRIRYYLDGVAVGEQEAAGPGRYSISTSWVLGAGMQRVQAWIDVESTLPLPAWSGHAEWRYIFPPVAYDVIALAPDFPAGGPSYVTWPYGSGVNYGPFSGDRWIYSHNANPAVCDDDMAINGVIVFPDGHAGIVQEDSMGGATAFLAYLPAGRLLNVNIWNAGGSYSASGELRLYNRPL